MACFHYKLLDDYYGAAACVDSVLLTYSTRTIATTNKMITKIETIPNKQTLHADIIVSNVKKCHEKIAFALGVPALSYCYRSSPLFCSIQKKTSINCQRSKSYSDSIDECENVKISNVKIRCFSSLTAIIYPDVLCFVLAVRAERGLC